jgi:transcriptional regulator
MYTPSSFEESDRNKLFDFIEQHSFGLLVCDHEGEPFATHIPFLVDRSAAPDGCLSGHMARANPHWKQAADQRVLAVFSGPHAYISPTWYQSENVVPTWNYVAVHVYGKFCPIHDDQTLMQILRRSVEVYEAPMKEPWRLDAESDFNKTLVRSIVGFRIEISHIEGKWKLSQNQPRERRQKVAAELDRSADRDARAIASLMTAKLASEEPSSP